ncbi:hypothetical protein BCR32DRAFT_288823 [Anaeromyces robustus]|uniref:Acyltransferase 3 domain-containing protein n=1 Tax=Anaeromyces robustus TaxID=1754192 RepID=A0A1Y1XQP3_9FUNG|nr:hypothetical protein BCR32DRAFT_288823 [Anaeromyces robustus]|eukprot:ORX88070.1 hypothetical protein BCR32DRAFT_288823 [Anaeromyces robustus]
MSNNNALIPEYNLRNEKSKNSLNIQIEEETTNGSCISLINDKNEEKEEEIIVKKKPSRLTHNTKRVLWADCLRIYACFLVILTHVCGYYTNELVFNTYNWYVIKAYNGLSRPCVPFFVMISGMFFLKPSKKITLKQMYSKYILRIFKSYVFWSLFYNIINNHIIVNKFPPEFNKEILNDIYVNTILGYGHLWYLPFCIGLYMVTPILKLIIPDRKMTWYMALLFCLISQFIPEVFDIIHHFCGTNILEPIRKFFTQSLTVEMAGSFTTYYLLGYLFSTQKLKKSQIYLCYVLGFIGAILSPILGLLYSYKLGKGNTYYFNFNCFHICMATVGGFVFFKYTVNDYIEKIRNKKWVVKIICHLSEWSFGIYLLHISINKCVYLISDTKISAQMFNPLFAVPVESIIIFVICVILTYLLRLIPFFRVVT